MRKCWYCGLDVATLTGVGWVHVWSGQKWTRHNTFRHDARPSGSVDDE